MLVSMTMIDEDVPSDRDDENNVDDDDNSNED